MNTIKVAVSREVLQQVRDSIKQIALEATQEEKHKTLNLSTPKQPALQASLQEMQAISAALLYYKAYLKQKGQTEQVAQIQAIDDRVFQLIRKASA